jgi:hydrogenase-4 component E
MTGTTYAELIGLCAGALLLTSVLTVWYRSQRASIRALALQGVALAALVAVVAVDRSEAELMIVAALVLVLKGAVLPWVLSRRPAPDIRVAADHGTETPMLNPVATLVAAALLAVVAYAVTWPLVAGSASPAAHAAPVGVAMVLIGFLVLVTRRRAISQLVGFLALDNGIATVAFLVSGGVPILIEFGVSLDILLITLILQVFSRRMRAVYGDTEVDRMRELHD